MPVSSNCTSSQFERPPTASSDRACLSQGLAVVVSNVAHYATSFVDASSQRGFEGFDYIASAGGRLGSGILPTTLKLDLSTNGQIAFELVPAGILRLYLALESGMKASLGVDLQWCLASTSPKAEPFHSDSVSTVLEAVLVTGNSHNLGVSWQVPEARFTDNVSCISFMANTTFSSQAWMLDRLFLNATVPERLRVRLSPGLQTYHLALTSTIAVRTLSSNQLALPSDPGPRVFLRDATAPFFTACPTGASGTVPSGSTGVLVKWARPVAVDNSDTKPQLSVTTIDVFNRSLEPAPLIDVDADDQGSIFYFSDAPLTVTYRAIDAAGNIARCVFPVTLTLVQDAFTVGAILAYDALRATASITQRPSVLEQHLMLADGAAAVPLAQFTALLASYGQLRLMLNASTTASPGNFRLAPTPGAVTTMVVDLAYTSATGLLPETPTVAAGVAAIVRFHTANGDEDVRLQTTELLLTADVIVVRGSTAALTRKVFHAVTLELSYPVRNVSDGGLPADTLYTLVAGSSWSITQFYPKLLSPFEVPQGLTFFSFDDLTPPLFTTCVAPDPVTASLGQRTAIVNWVAPVATDDLGLPVVQQVAGPTPGSTLGFTRTAPQTVIYRAINSAGLEAECKLQLHVLDKEPPALACPPATARLALPEDAPSVTVPGSVWQPTSAVDNSGENVSILAPETLTFSPGGFQLIIVGKDGSNNSARCEVALTVVDITPPVISACPEAQFVETRTKTQSLFWQAPTASDNYGIAEFDSNYPSGTSFAHGRTVVRYVAIDLVGLSTECHFTIKVVAPDSDSSSATTAVTLGSVGGVMGILVLVTLTLVVLHRGARRTVPADFKPIFANLHMSTDAGNRQQYPKELRRDAVTVIQDIGKGNFGTVAKAQYAERFGRQVLPAYLVAVKQLHVDATAEARREILLEAAVMAQFDHQHVLSLVGVVTKGDPILVVMEYMEHGSLQGFLRRETNQVSEAQRLIFAADIAEGLAYLHLRAFIHRDVAARNVLVSSGMRAKIADFGRTREAQAGSGYFSSQEGPIPVRWSAPETLEQLYFSPASDAFAYGVTLFEIWTDGAVPYGSWSNQRVWVQVVAGERLACPPGCNRRLYDQVIMPCWATALSDRPALSAVAAWLQDLLSREHPVASNVPAATTPEAEVFDWNSEDESADSTPLLFASWDSRSIEADDRSGVGRAIRLGARSKAERNRTPAMRQRAAAETMFGPVSDQPRRR